MSLRDARRQVRIGVQQIQEKKSEYRNQPTAARSQRLASDAREENRKGTEACKVWQRTNIRTVGLHTRHEQQHAPQQLDGDEELDPSPGFTGVDNRLIRLVG